MTTEPMIRYNGYPSDEVVSDRARIAEIKEKNRFRKSKKKCPHCGRYLKICGIGGTYVKCLCLRAEEIADIIITELDSWC